MQSFILSDILDINPVRTYRKVQDTCELQVKDKSVIYHVRPLNYKLKYNNQVREAVMYLVSSIIAISSIVMENCFLSINNLLDPYLTNMGDVIATGNHGLTFVLTTSNL